MLVITISSMKILLSISQCLSSTQTMCLLVTLLLTAFTCNGSRRTWRRSMICTRQSKVSLNVLMQLTLNSDGNLMTLKLVLTLRCGIKKWQKFHQRANATLREASSDKHLKVMAVNVMFTWWLKEFVSWLHTKSTQKQLHTLGNTEVVAMSKETSQSMRKQLLVKNTNSTMFLSKLERMRVFMLPLRMWKPKLLQLSHLYSCSYQVSSWF